MPLFRDFGLPEMLVILLLAVLFFGVGRISKVAGELGKGIRSFKDGLSGKNDAGEKEEEKQTPTTEPK